MDTLIYVMLGLGVLTAATGLGVYAYHVWCAMDPAIISDEPKTRRMHSARAIGSLLLIIGTAVTLITIFSMNAVAAA